MGRRERIRQSLVEERTLFGALIAISTGVDDAATLNVPIEVEIRLLKCYGDLGRD